MILARMIVVACLVAIGASSALAQSAPGITYGQVPTPAQWNNFFANKQDALGFSPLNAAGGVMSGRIALSPSTTAGAGLNLQLGTPPTSPVNGDVWETLGSLFAQIGGVTVDLVNPTPSRMPPYSGDCTSASGTTVLACTKSGGIPFAPSATIDATNAGNIGSGTLSGARLPTPGSTSLGGVKAGAAPAHQYQTGIDLTGTPLFAQPNIADIAGAATVASSGLASDLGGAFADASGVPASAPAFWYPNYYTNPGTARVHRFNRLLVGEAAQNSSDYGPVTTKDWLETLIPNTTSVSQITAVSSIGTSGITGAARTSDFRSIFGSATGGAQGVNGFGMNDDTGTPTSIGPIAAGGTFGGFRKAGVGGITLGAQISVANAGTVQQLTPNHGIVGNSTIPLLLTGDSIYSNNISALLVLGNGSLTGSGPPYAEKGIIGQAQTLDATLGLGGGGVMMEMAAGMDLRWLDASDNVLVDCWGNSNGFNCNSNASFNGGSLQLQNGTSNNLTFGSVGFGTPSVTTRSAGEKITLFTALTGTTVDYGFGVAAGSLWSSIPAANSSNEFDWYGGTTKVASLDGTGKLTTNGPIASGAQVSGAVVKVAPTTVAALPTCNSAAEGTFAAVTDANSTTYNAAAAGGGTNHVPVYCNGTGWTLH